MGFDRPFQSRPTIGPPVKVLMSGGRWKVPLKQRPTLAAPPKEWTATDLKVDKYINPMNGLGLTPKGLQFRGKGQEA